MASGSYVNMYSTLLVMSIMQCEQNGLRQYDMNKCERVQHALSDKCECLQHALSDKLV